LRAAHELKRLALIAVLALPAHAQDGMSPEAFRSLTEGKTLYFSQEGRFYGAEQYLKNNRVRWQYPNGECTEGQWYGQGNQLCFQYEDVIGAQCWIMWDEGGQLLARHADDPADIPIELDRKDELPLPCAGPDLGV